MWRGTTSQDSSFGSLDHHEHETDQQGIMTMPMQQVYPIDCSCACRRNRWRGTRRSLLANLKAGSLKGMATSPRAFCFPWTFILGPASGHLGKPGSDGSCPLFSIGRALDSLKTGDLYRGGSLVAMERRGYAAARSFLATFSHFDPEMR